MKLLAAINLEELFPLIIGLFWVIANVAGAAAKKKKKAAPARRPAPQQTTTGSRPERPSAPRDLEEFAGILRQMAGVEEVHAPEPLAEELPAEHSARQAVHTAKPAPIRKAAAIQKPDVRPIGQKAGSTETVKAVEKANAQVRPKMSAFRSSVPTIKMSTMPAMNLRIDNPSYAEASSGRQGLGSELHLTNRKALRRAMLSHIIFSPPKALEKRRIGMVE